MIGIGTAPLAEALAKIESLQRTIDELRTSPTMCVVREMIESQCAKENAELHRVVGEQKETIERVTKSASNRLVGLCQCGIERDKQSELIEKLRSALVRAWNNATGMKDNESYGVMRDAFTAYNKWEGGE